MQNHHVLLELRVGKDAQQTAESAVQLLSATPVINNYWWHRLLNREESLCWEIALINQTIYFYCRAPLRLYEYIKATLIASYPEITIKPVEYDPFAIITLYQEHGYIPVTGYVYPENTTYPLKTYREFKDTDPITPLVSTLSQLQPYENILIQYSIAPINSMLKNIPIFSALTQPTSPTPTTSEETSSPTLKQAHRLYVSIKILAQTASPERSHMLLDSIGASFQTLNNIGTNTLRMHKTFFFKKHFLHTMSAGSLRRTPTLQLSVEEIATLFHLPNAHMSTIPNIAWGKKLLGEPPEHLPIISKDMDPLVKKEINPFAICEYKNQPTIYGLKRGDRRRHMYVIGKTGTGKSTLLANMAINDLKNDEGMCVIDPHGDLVETLLNYIPSRRINDVIYFDPADPEHTVQLNLFEGENVVHRELIASGIVAVFQKLYAYSWGPRLEHILRNSLLTLLKSERAKLSDVVDLLTDSTYRKKIIDSLQDPILKNFWVNEFEAMQDRQRNEAIAPILNKVGQFVASPLVRNVVNATRSSFSIEQAMDEGKIILVNLSQGRLGEDNATLLGAMLITKIQLAAMSRVNIPEENRRDFYLYVDEFQNFATGSFIKILSEARKYRLNLILANQYIAQIPEEVQRAIFGNCGSILSFVMGAEDASVFNKEYGNRYSEQDLVSLTKHQIINKITIDNIISDPFPAFTLALARSQNQNKEKVIRVSRERYAAAKSA